MHQLAWPNPNCTALNYKMPETSKVNVGYKIKKWASNMDGIVYWKLEGFREHKSFA